jgi:hypothetical protein
MQRCPTPLQPTAARRDRVQFARFRQRSRRLNANPFGGFTHVNHNLLFFAVRDCFVYRFWRDGAQHWSDQ